MKVIAVLTLCLLSAACATTTATVSPQPDPVTIDPFVGAWSGKWVGSRSPQHQGELVVFINPNLEGLAVTELWQQSSGRPFDHVTLSLRDGALWHEGKRIEMRGVTLSNTLTVRILAADRLEAIQPHDWARWPSASVWSLRRVSESEARARVEAWRRDEDRRLARDRARGRSWFFGGGFFGFGGGPGLGGSP